MVARIYCFDKGNLIILSHRILLIKTEKTLQKRIQSVKIYMKSLPGFDPFPKKSLKMPTFCFLIDTSFSMNRLFSNNLTYLECAKSAVEKFVEKSKKVIDTKNSTFVLGDLVLR